MVSKYSNSSPALNEDGWVVAKFSEASCQVKRDISIKKFASISNNMKLIYYLIKTSIHTHNAQKVNQTIKKCKKKEDLAYLILYWCDSIMVPPVKPNWHFCFLRDDCWSRWWIFRLQVRTETQHLPKFFLWKQAHQKCIVYNIYFHYVIT